MILSFCLITTAVLAAGRCVPCKLNHYCVDGLRYQCPSTAPVTQGTGAGALNECLTCVQRNGNSANPIYDDLVGDCVSCYEYDSSTPIWDGNACVACENGGKYNTTTGLCESSIIEIDSAEELALIGKDSSYPLDGDYILTDTIDLDGITWEPIANFSGTFDGVGFSIKHLYINSSSDSNVGLFASSSGTIKNLQFYNPYILGKNNVGVVVGYNTGIIKDCGVSGSVIVASGSSVGGIAGINYGEILNSNSTGTSISGATFGVGGIVGTTYAQITNCNVYSLSVDEAASCVGGIVGQCGVINGCVIDCVDNYTSDYGCMSAGSTD